MNWNSKGTVNKLLILIFILYSAFILFYSVYFINPIPIGDGNEYLGMTISLFDHFTPDLREEDIALREQILAKNGIIFDEKYDYGGYFESLNGSYYSYHFWIYSLLNLPVFSILHHFNLNELRSFQITNSILLLFSLFMILNIKYTRLNRFQRSWLFLFLAFNPILLYIRWTHPEVFIYSFIVIGICFYLKNNYPLAVLASSIASLQSPAVSILTIYLIICGWNVSRHRLSELSLLFISGSISAIPYIFYYLNYHTTNLIVYYGASSIRYITIDKILSLFFDLNFGLIVYIPLLMFMSLFLLIASIMRKDLVIPSLWLVLIFMAIIYSTQNNWNCGMMYIHRYSVCLLPIIILIFVYGIPKEPNKNISKYLSISFLITFSITGVLLYDYDLSNYVQFNTLSTLVLINAPSLYNPPYDVFAERTLNAEPYSTTLPIILTYEGFPRKALTDYDNLSIIEDVIDHSIGENNDNSTLNKKFFYINYENILFEFPYDKSELAGIHEMEWFSPSEMLGAFGPNWYGLEDWCGTPTRWMKNDAILIIYSDEVRNASLSFNALSFHRPRTLEIYVNGQPHIEAEVPIEGFVAVGLPIDLKKGVNTVKLHVPEGCDRPYDIVECNDKRCLSLAIQNINITD